jgi:hypothetical protein
MSSTCSLRLSKSLFFVLLGLTFINHGRGSVIGLIDYTSQDSEGETHSMELVKIEVTAGMELTAYVQSAEKYIRNSKATNPVRAYHADWEDFTAWCADRGITSLPLDPRRWLFM